MSSKVRLFLYTLVNFVWTITKLRGKDRQSVSLDVKLFEVCQLTDLLRQWDQIIVSQT